MLLHSRNKNMYTWFSGGYLDDFRDIGTFPLSGRKRTTPYGHDLHYNQQMLLEKRNNMYGLWLGISTVFKIFSNFPFLGVGLTTGAISN
jgi:hypothetical protein